MLAKCGMCDAEFVTTGIVNGSATVSMIGCRVNCIRCGGAANVLDGNYEIHENKIVGLTGPKITLQVAERLRAIARKANEGEIAAQEIITEIAGISPALAEKLVSKKGMGIGFLILVLIFIVKSVTLDIKIDINRLIDQVSGMSDERGKYNLPDNFDEATLPEPAIIREPASPTIAAGPATASQNRKERRRLASLQRKGERRKA